MHIYVFEVEVCYRTYAVFPMCHHLCLLFYTIAINAFVPTTIKCFKDNYEGHSLNHVFIMNLFDPCCVQPELKLILIAS